MFVDLAEAVAKRGLLFDIRGEFDAPLDDRGQILPALERFVEAVECAERLLFFGAVFVEDVGVGSDRLFGLIQRLLIE